MKTKKFNKKLVLKKSTIADLTDSQLATLKGGTTATCVTQPRYTCSPYCTRICNTDYVCTNTCP